MYFAYLVATVEAILEQNDCFFLVLKEEHGAIHTRDVYVWSRLDNLVVRWASTMLCVIVVWVCVEDPGSRNINGFYEGNPLLFQVLL